MKLSSIPEGSAVFVDANIFLYTISNHFKFGIACKEFLKRIRDGSLQGYASVGVLNEVLHHLVFAEIAHKNQIRLTEVASHLKASPQTLSGLNAYDSARLIANIPNLTIFSLSPEILSDAIGLMQQHRLLSNDALHLAVMKREGLEAMASRESDFQRVPWLKLFLP